MILTFLLSLLDAFLNMMFSILPSGHLPAAIATAFTTVFTQLGKFKAVFPVGDLLAALTLVVYFETALLLFRVAQWVYHQIWGSK